VEVVLVLGQMVHKYLDHLEAIQLFRHYQLVEVQAHLEAADQEELLLEALQTLMVRPAEMVA
jgi:hypothetical protein